MPTPANRVPVRIGRGTKANIDIAVAAGDLKEGELVYVTDENALYTIEGGVLTQASADLSTASINELLDVDTSTVAPTDGQALVWDNANSQWEPGQAGATTIDGLTDVDTSTVAPTDGQALVWDNANSQWEPGTVSGGTSLPAASDGEALIYENGQWVAGPVIGGVNYTPSGDSNFSNVSLLLHMDGTNGSSTFTDSSSNAFTQSSSTASLTTSELKFGTAGGDFTTTGHTVKFANDAAFRFSTGDFTIEGWFKPTVAGTKSVCGVGTNLSDGFTLFLSSDEAIFRTSGTNDLTASISISTTAFTHVAFVREGNTRNIYVDGSLAASDTLSFDISNTTDPFAVGSLDTSSASFRYAGYIDEFRVTKGVARYTSAFTVPTAAFPDFGNTPITIPYSIDNLDDVDTSTVAPVDGDVLVYDNANTKFIPGVRVKSDTTQGGTGSSAVANIVTISQVDYDALATPDANTIYFIV